jgi:hypothetical protein
MRNLTPIGLPVSEMKGTRIISPLLGSKDTMECNGMSGSSPIFESPEGSNIKQLSDENNLVNETLYFRKSG